MGNLAMYATKGFEYLLILGFLALFTLFYLYFTSRRFEKATGVVRHSIERLAEWFRVPDTVLFHQGHTWVRPGEQEPELVKIGMDDFAHKVAGPMGIRDYPAVGKSIRQGEKAWSLANGKVSVDMLAPISGEVVEVNRAMLAGPAQGSGKTAIAAQDDPYGHGWILKVRPENYERERKGLLSGSLARKWTEEAADQLRLRMTPELGAVMQDGGVPVTGMAKNIDEENWSRLLQEFFLT